MAAPSHTFIRTPTEAEIAGVDVRLHYLQWGPPLAPPILFLHGGGLTAHSWDVVCDLMSGDHRCVGVDLRGHGDSAWSEVADYTLEAHASDVGLLTKTLALRELVLVGQSLGGLVALTFAALNPASVRALVLVDVGVGGSKRSGRERLRAFMDGPAEHDTVEEFVDRAIAFNPRRPRERLRRSLLHNLRRTARGTWTWKYDPRITDPFRKMDPDSRRRRVEAAAAQIRCPVLVVRGEQSDHFHLEDALATTALFSHARMVSIPGAGHTVQGDQPQLLAKALGELFVGI